MLFGHKVTHFFPNSIVIPYLYNIFLAFRRIIALISGKNIPFSSRYIP